MSSIEIRVCGRYRMGEKIYKGKFSSVYIGKNVQSNAECAIKCQSKGTKIPLILHEGAVLESIQGGIGVPNLHWYGLDEDFNFIVTDLLGNTLEDYFEICKREFSLKTVLMIADQVLNNIEYLHFKGYLHRDIKPENFLMGLGKKLSQIFTIDYANATPYLDSVTKEHVAMKENRKSFYGTIRYASLNTHRGITNSRRDDLEALGYMLVYFMKARLPWMDIKTNSVTEKLEKTKQSKESTTLQELCEGLPVQFEKYLRYCRELQYDEKPDYSYLKRLFKQKFISQGYEYDYVFDWILIPLKLKDPEVSSKIPLITYMREEPASFSYFNLHIEKGEQTAAVIKKEPQQENKKSHPMQMKPPVQPPRENEKDPTKKKKDDCRLF